MTWYQALERQAHVDPCQCGSGQPGAHCQSCRREAEGCSGIPQPDIDPARCNVCQAARRG